MKRALTENTDAYKPSFENENLVQSLYRERSLIGFLIDRLGIASARRVVEYFKMVPMLSGRVDHNPNPNPNFRSQPNK